MASSGRTCAAVKNAKGKLEAQMSDEWGAVRGDDDARSITRDRRDALTTLTLKLAVSFLVLVALGVWYALTGSRIALASEIAVAAICAAGWVLRSQFETHTFVMIAEQRARNIETIASGLEDSALRIEGRFGR